MCIRCRWIRCLYRLMYIYKWCVLSSFAVYQCLSCVFSLSRKKNESHLLLNANVYCVAITKATFFMLACCDAIDKTHEKPFGVWPCGFCPVPNRSISELYVPGALRSSHNARWSYGRPFTKGLTIMLSLLAWNIRDYHSETSYMI